MRFLTVGMLGILLVSAGVFGAEAAWELTVGTDGRLMVQREGKTLLTFQPGLFAKGWQGGKNIPLKEAGPDPRTKLMKLVTPAGAAVHGSAQYAPGADGKSIEATFTFTPEQDVELNSLHVAADAAAELLIGGTWKAGDQEGTFPKDLDGEKIHLFGAEASGLELRLPENGPRIALQLKEARGVLVQDNRKWGPSFSVRLSAGNGEGAERLLFKKDRAYTLGFTVQLPEPAAVEIDAPVVLTAGPEWKPLNMELDIEAGSALDFSKLGHIDAPAGKHGWLKASPAGQFVFEQAPDKPVRFYGVNFCFSANYITHEQSDILTERLVRLGYNSVRIHHHEIELCKDQPNSTTFHPEKLDQLDYLLAACAKRGLYITTDLYISRPVKAAEYGGDAQAGRRNFKLLAPVHDGAFENWKLFTKNFLSHVNPYTKKSYAEDPALAWLSMVNEGNFGNYYGELKSIPEWQAAWNRWLTTRYTSRAKLNEAWPGALKDGEDPAQGSVPLPGDLWNAKDIRHADLLAFLAFAEKDFFERMAKFVREDLGCKALLTNCNGWTTLTPDQIARDAYDYADDHFYIDHPEFIDKSWQLPSRCGNSSPVAGGARGGRDRSFTRLFDKPFTISEYNYSAPGRFRGVGGILTGALGALQNWDVLWRFAYSHNRDSMFSPKAMDYFNMSADPLGQASERAAMLLYVRRDMKAAPHRVAVVMTPEDLERPAANAGNLAPRWHWAAWVTQVGTDVVSDPAAKLPYDLTIPVGWNTPPERYTGSTIKAGLSAYGSDDAAILEALKETVLPAGNRTDPAKKILESETGELLIDGPRDIMVLNTPRTAGGYAPAGQTVDAALGGVKITMRESDATAWVSALDDAPIANSKRLLVTHLTDLQNTEIKYAERARQTLLAWGKLPHLVRTGQAEIRIKRSGAEELKVWALSTGGKRLAEVPSRLEGGELIFTADVAGGGEAEGARMLYEAAVK
ncbi:MAG: hypothetical protein AMXMBFR7_51310 [Planctomycetota bacterium]